MSVELLQSLGITKEELMSHAIEALVATMREELSGEADKEIRKLVREQAAKAIEEQLKLTCDELLSKPYQPRDEWGEPRGKPTSLREMVKEKSIAFLNEKVDKDGRTNGYGGDRDKTRVAWYVTKITTEALDNQVKAELNAAVETAKTQLRNQVAKHIADTLLKT